MEWKQESLTKSELERRQSDYMKKAMDMAKRASVNPDIANTDNYAGNQNNAGVAGATEKPKVEIEPYFVENDSDIMGAENQSDNITNVAGAAQNNNNAGVAGAVQPNNNAVVAGAVQPNNNAGVAGVVKNNNAGTEGATQTANNSGIAGAAKNAFENIFGVAGAVHNAVENIAGVAGAVKNAGAEKPSVSVKKPAVAGAAKSEAVQPSNNSGVSVVTRPGSSVKKPAVAGAVQPNNNAGVAGVVQPNNNAGVAGAVKPNNSGKTETIQPYGNTGVAGAVQPNNNAGVAGAANHQTVQPTGKKIEFNAEAEFDINMVFAKKKKEEVAGAHENNAEENISTRPPETIEELSAAEYETVDNPFKNFNECVTEGEESKSAQPPNFNNYINNYNNGIFGKSGAFGKFGTAGKTGFTNNSQTSENSGVSGKFGTAGKSGTGFSWKNIKKN